MLFGKPKQPVASATPRAATLSWEEPSQPRQSMWLAVHGWDFKVFPMLRARAGMQFMFDFEGVVTNGAMRGLSYTGSIEVLDDLEPPRMLMDSWKQVPEVVEGHGQLLERTDPSFADSFGLTLYCTLPALDWVHRAFATGLQSRHGGLGIDLQLDCPNNPGGDFWASGWRKETLRIT